MTPIRIGLMTEPADHERTGIGRYKSDLIESLIRANAREKNPFEFHLISPSPSPLPLQGGEGKGEGTKLIPTYVIPNPFRFVSRTYLWWPWAAAQLKKSPFHIIHNLSQRPTFFKFKQKYLITLYDTTPLLLPECYSKIHTFAWRRFMNRTLTGAGKIIAVSETTKNDVLHFFPSLAPDRIKVIYSGISSEFTEENTPPFEAVLKKYGLRRPFLLCVGTIEPRKNLSLLLRAFSKIRSEFQNYALVLVGKKGFRADQILAGGKSLNLTHCVTYLNYVGDKDLPALYGLAEALVYPSLYEGFGFPPLEALACGTAAAVSNVPALQEVLKDSVIYFDPHSEHSLAFAVKKILSDEPFKKELIEKGQIIIRQYDWNKTAEAVMELYRSLV